uniref:Uncharacterized protein n=1 Tax=Marseillevirus LCMAC202 TaxID=2506606 RepID=A0A481YXT0_9VIRU|nr:MAG: hypothetical protein LCMAC202_00670 [Marseillevirus LCMAC202]
MESSAHAVVVVYDDDGLSGGLAAAVVILFAGLGSDPQPPSSMLQLLCWLMLKTAIMI